MFNVVLLLSLSHTGHWKFNIAPNYAASAVSGACLLLSVMLECLLQT